MCCVETFEGEVRDRAVSWMGKDGAMVLVQHKTFDRYIARMLNGFDVKVLKV